MDVAQLALYVALAAIGLAGLVVRRTIKQGSRLNQLEESLRPRSDDHNHRATIGGSDTDSTPRRFRRE